MNIQDLRKFVEANPDLVDVRKSVVYPEYSVVKYKKKVFWDNLWTPELEKCRGLVIDSNWNVISRPFNKIYNYGIEDRAPVIDENILVKAERKINGFMVAVSWDTLRQDIVISTTGSVDSPFVGMAKQSLFSMHPDPYGFIKLFSQIPNETHLFECVHEDDPHIVQEPVKGLYYLGTMMHNLEDDLVYSNHSIQMFFHRPEVFMMKLKDLIELNKTVKHEGFVFMGMDEKEKFFYSKMKSPYYLINKFFARKKSVDDVVTHKAKEIFDEEYYPLIKEIENNQKYFTSLSEQERLAYICKFYGV